MLNYLIELHTQMFFWLHSFSKISLELNYWLYIIAERIDLYVICIGILSIFVYHYRYRNYHLWSISHTAVKEAVFIITAVLFAWSLAYIMKITFTMPRPYIRFASEVLPLFPYGGYDSFPSGHATLFSALATAIYYLHKKIGFVFILIAIFISISRVIAGVHFPIDIVVGWILGSGIVWFLIKFMNKPIKKIRL